MTLAVSPTDSLAQSLGLVYGCTWARVTTDLLFLPERDGNSETVEAGIALIEDVLASKLPDWLLPLAWVDGESVACVVIADQPGCSIGEVRRLHLRPVPPKSQLALIDVDPLLYVASLDEELRTRTVGLKRLLDQVGPAYEASHLDTTKRPRDYVLRPVRIACQNVIVGLAAIAQDASFDGLAVPAWQTCEVPHVATHEGNRALAALTLCDAFQNGGTMEIRFDRAARVMVDGKPITFEGHPEKAVPASLRRFGRTVGVTLGAEDPAAITPAEARALFQAITPMPPDLRRRVLEAAERFGLTPERVCFSLLSGVWTGIELDFLLACSARVNSILTGGAEWTDRVARQAESDVCRAAVMTGMFLKRVDALDSARPGDAGVARVVEDRKRGVSWSIDAEAGAVSMHGLDDTSPIPWSRTHPGVSSLRLIPRSGVTPTTSPLLLRMMGQTDTPCALLIPRDAPEPECSPEVVVLRCPERLADIDKVIEGRLLTMRISRA